MTDNMPYIANLEAPKLVEIEPFHGCNLRCLMCHVKYEELTNTKLNIKFLDNLNGIENTWALLGSGYEPFMHPDIVRIIQKLDALNVNIDLTTNGTLLNPKVVSLIKDAKFRNVSFSVDGVTKDTYETIRKNANFDNTIKNISDFMNRIRDCYYSVNYTVSKINLYEISRAVDFFEKMGFDHLGFISMVIRADSEDVRNLSIEGDLAEYTKLLDESAQKIINGNYKITISSPQFLHDRYLSEKYKDYLVDTTLRSRNKSSRAPFNPRNGFQTGSFPGMQIACRSPFVFARILYDGAVLLCNRFDIGSIYQNNLMDIWHSDRANFVRKIIMDNPKICFSCDYYKFCLKADDLDYAKKETHYADSIVKDANPHLIEAYKNYNIVLWRSKYYSIHHSLGRIGLELFLAEFNKVEGVITAGSIEDSKKMIDKTVAKSDYLQPTLEVLFENKQVVNPKVSIILLDWSCRESFHSLDYLNKQTLPRQSYELIWIEYYSRKSAEIGTKLKNSSQSPIVDQWITLNMPEDTYYHKHLMYNVGIVKSRGDIVVICDSDAIYEPSFIETIIQSFQTDPNIVLHLDQVRNVNKKFYPFCYPSIEKLLGSGCVNFLNGKTTGVTDNKDPLHSRNYGACMAAKKSDIIEIGGADEHIDFLGHVCGPYDMTFRLKNLGKKEVWHQEKFLYHAWHPGQSGDENYVGPHDGKLLSTTALKSLDTGRIYPLVENEAVKLLRTGGNFTDKLLEQKLIDKSYTRLFSRDEVSRCGKMQLWHTHELIRYYRDFNVIRYKDKFYGVPTFLELHGIDKEMELETEESNHPTIVTGRSVRAVVKQIKKFDPLSLTPKIIDCYEEFNIVRYGRRIYGVPIKMAGGTDFHSSQQRYNIRDISANTSEAVKKLIDKTDRSLYYPVMLETYKEHNIIKHNGKIYGIPKSLGKVDLFDAQQRNKEEILCADTLGAVKRMIELPTGLSAGSRDEAKKLICSTKCLSDTAVLLYEYKNYNIVKYDDCYYAVPQSIGSVDFCSSKERLHPEILSSDDCNKLNVQIDKLEKTSPIEYTGWLPAFCQFGNCGSHPQFAHIKTPPDGYRFTYSTPKLNGIVFKKKLRLWMTFFVRGLLLFISVFKFTASAWLKGAKLRNIFRFLKSRNIKSQILLSRKSKLLFLPSVPYTLGQQPWVIEIEDPISLLFPFVHNGYTCSENFHKSPYLPVFRALFESKSCKAIITHIKSTAESLPKLFQSPKIASKITYIPVGIKLPKVCGTTEKANDNIRILFNNSWHQDPRSFFIRGGLDVLAAFDKLCEKYPNVILTLRTSLPCLDSRYMKIIERNNIKVIDSFLPEDEWKKLMMNSDIYLLPSDRIHVVSMLEAMSYGMAVVVSDGWGVQDYVEHGKNGMVVNGRYGKITWMDETTGMLRENYEIMKDQDPYVVDGIVDTVSRLIEDEQLRMRLGRRARKDIEEKFNMENWNNGLKTVFDKIFSRV